LDISKWWFMRPPKPQLTRDQQWLPSLARVAAAVEKRRGAPVNGDGRPWDFSPGATLQANGFRALAYLSRLLGDEGRRYLVGGVDHPQGMDDSHRPIYEPLVRQVPNQQGQPQGLLGAFSYNNNYFKPLCMAHTKSSGSYFKFRLGRWGAMRMHAG
jgi:hypothetical protein